MPKAGPCSLSPRARSLTAGPPYYPGLMYLSFLKIPIFSTNNSITLIVAEILSLVNPKNTVFTRLHIIP